MGVIGGERKGGKICFPLGITVVALMTYLRYNYYNRISIFRSCGRIGTLPLEDALGEQMSDRFPTEVLR